MAVMILGYKLDRRHKRLLIAIINEGKIQHRFVPEVDVPYLYVSPVTGAVAEEKGRRWYHQAKWLWGHLKRPAALWKD